MTAYRNQGFSQLLTFVSIAAGAGSVLYAVARPDGGSFGDRAFPAAVAVGFALFCWLRLARAGVIADEEGIRIINPFSTKRVPWSRVEGFACRAHRGFPALGFVQLDDGSELQMWGIQARNNSTGAKRIARDLVAQLNARLDQERASSPA